MYLTRFRINTARPGAHRLLGSPHLLHGAVNMAFPEPPPRDGTAPRVLWRVDPAAGGRADLLVVSPRRPDLTHLVEQAGWPATEQPGWTTYAYDEFLNRLAAGETWSFRLTANPVHHIHKPDDPKGARTKRTAHVTPRHQIGWLVQRQEQAGFEITRTRSEAQSSEDDPQYEVVVHNRLPRQFRKGTPDFPRHDVRFTQVTYDGRLRITDLGAFRRTLIHGLGKSKAYGCGLLTLAPTQTP